MSKSDRQGPAGTDLLLIVVLNLLPIGGVLFWDWRVFDIVFLYWIENLIIGAFSAMRMVVRPYLHPLDLVFPAFMAPFFAMHYGFFCYGHGLFVMSMFGDPGAPSTTMSASVMAALADNTMLVAVVALMTLQAIDWLRDTLRDGLGADGIKELMVAPYRRIVVLHLTILFGGFAVLSIGEPIAGLLLLIIIKTASDIWHSRKPTALADDTPASITELSAEDLARMDKEFPEPKVTVNGKDKIFDSFAAMRESREFRMMESVLRMMGAKKELRLINSYMKMKIAEENAAVTH